MIDRPIFVQGWWRRLLIRLELHPAEAIAIAGIAIVVVVAATLNAVVARAGTHEALCAPPDDTQVLVWYRSRDSPVCQYIERPQD